MNYPKPTPFEGIIHSMNRFNSAANLQRDEPMAKIAVEFELARGLHELARAGWDLEKILAMAEAILQKPVAAEVAKSV